MQPENNPPLKSALPPPGLCRVVLKTGHINHTCQAGVLSLDNNQVPSSFLNAGPQRSLPGREIFSGDAKHHWLYQNTIECALFVLGEA